jgi:hypothetical protein
MHFYINSDILTGKVVKDSLNSHISVYENILLNLGWTLTLKNSKNNKK